MLSLAKLNQNSSFVCRLSFAAGNSIAAGLKTGGVLVLASRRTELDIVIEKRGRCEKCHLFSQLFLLCLSRACLGKIMASIYTYALLKQGVFARTVCLVFPCARPVRILRVGSRESGHELSGSTLYFLEGSFRLWCCLEPDDK